MFKKAAILCLVGLILILLSTVALGKVYESKQVALGDNQSIGLDLDNVERGEEITINIDSENEINIYIINSYEFSKRHIHGLNNSVFTRKRVQDITFNWTVSSDRDYVLVLENPNDFSIEAEVTYHTKNLDIDFLENMFFEDIMCCCGGLGIGFVLVIVIIIYIKD